MGRNTLAVIGLTAVIAAGVGTCTVVNHVWKGSSKTREIATPDYLLENMRWFKNQSSAIDQTEFQIKSSTQEIQIYKKDFEATPRVDWPFDAREELSRKESVLRGYISQHNMLIKDYNARVSDATRAWAKGDEPKEIRPFLRQYEPIK